MDLPFSPLWLIAQGSIPKYDGRARPVQDASMSRDELFCINGEPVFLSTSGAGRRERDAAIAAGAEHVEEQKHLDDARRPSDRRVVPVVKAGTYVSA